MEKLSRPLEITVISAEGLRLDGRSVKKNAFATVRIDSYNHQSTRMDAEGGSYPSWNEKFKMALPSSVRIITVEVQCKTFSGVRTVGTMNVPVSDFAGDYTPASYLHFLSYRLRDRHGERNGIINLSIRMLVPEYDGQPLPRLGFGAAQKSAPGIAIGIPVAVGCRVQL